MYTFTTWDVPSGSMLLLSPPTAADLRPLYHIQASMNLNPFVPTSHVTTVRRGGTAFGDFVGEFEWVYR